jgi:vacuolar-type H+-ATPase subunit E/Vma4
MGLTHLLEALERDARNEVERLTAAARAEADGITADARARLDERRRVALDEVERRHRFEMEQALTAARRVGRRTVLEARQRLMQRVLDALRASLPGALALPAYRDGLPDAVRRALAALGEGSLVIRCTPAIRSTIETIERPSGVSVVPDDSIGNGFVIHVADGSVEVVETLEERLVRQRTDLTRWVFDHLAAEA